MKCTYPDGMVLSPEGHDGEKLLIATWGTATDCPRL